MRYYASGDIEQRCNYYIRLLINGSLLPTLPIRVDPHGFITNMDSMRGSFHLASEQGAQYTLDYNSRKD